MVASGIDPKQFARQKLMEDIQDRMQPKYSADQQTINAANQQRGINVNQAAQNQAIKQAGKTSTSRGNKGKSDADLTADYSNFSTELANIPTEGAGDLSALTGFKDTVYNDGKIYIGTTEVTKDQLLRLYLKKQGYDAARIDNVIKSQKSPTKRVSPLKRFTNWMGMTK